MSLKYTCSVEISQSIDVIMSLWLDENNNAKWQDGFVSRKLLEGKQDEEGFKYEIILSKAGKRWNCLRSS